MRLQNEKLGQFDARLVALRKAIAATRPDLGNFEAQLLQYEKDAQAVALSAQGFPELDALFRLLKVGKNPDSLDS
jgi:hypothetical protein